VPTVNDDRLVRGGRSGRAHLAIEGGLRSDDAAYHAMCKQDQETRSLLEREFVLRVAEEVVREEVRVVSKTAAEL